MPIRLFFWFPAGFPYILQNSGELCAVSSDVIAAIRCNSQTKTFILVRTFLMLWSKGREKQSRGWKRTMSMERYFSTQLKQRLNQTGKYVFLWYGNFCMLLWKSNAKKEKINKNLVLRTSTSLKRKQGEWKAIEELDLLALNSKKKFHAIKNETRSLQRHVLWN